ncbi:MAG: hypothetical protein UR12_C0004G0039 [candidate division TM6 bacterium GW2011_GWF2_30_66]|nr:MAG: hypothetical protein UR12_C0004G0039 [candidate division TM6 bacterium GW2011_GWF2_30_66]
MKNTYFSKISLIFLLSIGFYSNNLLSMGNNQEEILKQIQQQELDKINTIISLVKESPSITLDNLIKMEFNLSNIEKANLQLSNNNLATEIAQKKQDNKNKQTSIKPENSDQPREDTIARFIMGADGIKIPIDDDKTDNCDLACEILNNPQITDKINYIIDTLNITMDELNSIKKYCAKNKLNIFNEEICNEIDKKQEEITKNERKKDLEEALEAQRKLVEEEELKEKLKKEEEKAKNLEQKKEEIIEPEVVAVPLTPEELRKKRLEAFNNKQKQEVTVEPKVNKPEEIKKEVLVEQTITPEQKALEKEKLKAEKKNRIKAKKEKILEIIRLSKNLKNQEIINTLEQLGYKEKNLLKFINDNIEKIKLEKETEEKDKNKNPETIKDEQSELNMAQLAQERLRKQLTQKEQKAKKIEEETKKDPEVKPEIKKSASPETTKTDTDKNKTATETPNGENEPKEEDSSAKANFNDIVSDNKAIKIALAIAASVAIVYIYRLFADK